MKVILLAVQLLGGYELGDTPGEQVQTLTQVYNEAHCKLDESAYNPSCVSWCNTQMLYVSRSEVIEVIGVCSDIIGYEDVELQ